MWIDESPRNLGTQIEYLGSREHGCAPFPLSFFCPSPHSTQYYFATSIAFDKLKNYFSRAQYDESRGQNIGGGIVVDQDNRQLNYTLKELLFRPAEGDLFDITYYDNKEAILAGENLPNTDKLYIISMDPESYLRARSAL